MIIYVCIYGSEDKLRKQYCSVIQLTIFMLMLCNNNVIVNLIVVCILFNYHGYLIGHARMSFLCCVCVLHLIIFYYKCKLSMYVIFVQ